jgi:hypothetical protein
VREREREKVRNERRTGRENRLGGREKSDKRVANRVVENESTIRKNNHFYYDYNFLGRTCAVVLSVMSCLRDRDGNDHFDRNDDV